MAIYRATIVGNIWGASHYNVLHFSKDSAVPNEPQLLADELQTGWCTLLKPSFSGDLKLTGCIVQEVTTPLPASFTKNWASITGNLPTNGAANQLCVIFKLPTLLAGRSHQGRIYIGGLQNGNLINGRFQATAMTNYQNTVNTLKARYMASGGSFTGYQIGVFSRKKYEAGAGANGSFTPAADMTIIDVPATQRRRRLGVGI